MGAGGCADVGWHFTQLDCEAYFCKGMKTCTWHESEYDIVLVVLKVWHAPSNTVRSMPSVHLHYITFWSFAGHTFIQKRHHPVYTCATMVKIRSAVERVAFGADAAVCQAQVSCREVV